MAVHTKDLKKSLKDIPKIEINMAANRDYSCDELQF